MLTWPPALRTVISVFPLLTAAAVAAAPAARRRPRGLTATVIAPPSRATLAVLLTPDGHQRLGRAVLDTRPLTTRPVRRGRDRLALSQLRPGDRLRLRVRGGRVRSIALRSSGVGDAFDDLDARLAHLGATSRLTIALAAPITEGRSGCRPRSEVRALRSELTRLEAELTAVGDDLDTSLRRLDDVLPADPTRRAAVQAAQAGYASRLSAVRDCARAAAEQTVVAADALGATAEGSGSEVSSLSERLGDVLASLDLPRP